MRGILIASLVLVIATVMTGFVLYFKGSDPKKLKKAIQINLGVFIPLLLTGIAFLVPDMVYAAAEEGAASAKGLGFISAALSTGLAAIGTGYAVGAVGSSALGAVSEDPKILGKTLIFVGLAEGIAIYGLIISILILGRL